VGAVEPTKSRERSAPTFVDRVAAQAALSRPAHKRRSLVLNPAVSMDSVDAGSAKSQILLRF
jgi:hypothetical protein